MYGLIDMCFINVNQCVNAINEYLIPLQQKNRSLAKTETPL